MRVGGWWGQWRLDSRDVQWPLIGCLILQSKFFFASFWCINEFGAHFPLEYTNWSLGSDFMYNSIVVVTINLLSSCNNWRIPGLEVEELAGDTGSLGVVFRTVTVLFFNGFCFL